MKLTRKKIISHTVTLGLSTFISKVIGLLREIFMARYFGVGPIADAFFTAFRIPNSLRKIFAEGALSAAFVPTIVKIVKHDGQDAASRFMTLSFVFVQGLLLLVCCTMFYGAHSIMACIAPGWSTELVAVGYTSSEKLILAVGLFKVLIFFILFVSASSLIAGALQAVSHFAMPAWSQIIMNILFVAELWLCSYYNLSVWVLTFFIIFNGLVLALLHAVLYFRKGYRFMVPHAQSWAQLGSALKKFIPCMIGMGAIEINLFIDQAIASYLPSGSISLLQYTYGFVRVPLGIFAVTFSTILLSHFSQVSSYAPGRMGFYLLESAKIVLWVTLPASIMMIFLSKQLFYTTLLSAKFTLDHVNQASILLSLFLSGLFFMSFNKIVLNMYYALHETMVPTLITIISTIVNTVLNIIGIYFIGLPGVIIATVIASAIQSVLLVIVLNKRMGMRIYLYQFVIFAGRYCLQLMCAGWILYSVYLIMYCYVASLPEHIAWFFLHTIGYWLWIGPLCGIFFIVIYVTRKLFGIRSHFLS